MDANCFTNLTRLVLNKALKKLPSAKQILFFTSVKYQKSVHRLFSLHLTKSLQLLSTWVWRIIHQSIPAVPIPPRATAGHLLKLSVPGVGHSQFYRAPGGWALAYPGRAPGICHTCFRKTDKFIGKDEAFVKDWLVHQGLEKLVDVFKGIFSQF